MVKITSELIIRQGSHVKKRSNESNSQFLRRLTHIYFQEKGIEVIENLSECRNLSVLYLYDNTIKEIRNLGFAYNLTHLYLQKNEITRTAGLEKLERLTKLYLGYNQIAVLEGLENLKQLSELHIECQSLPAGEKLLFDPRSLETLSKSLEVLNVAGNNLDEIADLKCLRHISHFMANDNDLNDFMDIGKCLGSWFNLTSLDLAGNPLCHKKKYRDKIILMSRSIVSLDGKEINNATRNFLQNWYASKQTRRLQRKQKELDGSDENDNLVLERKLPALRQYSQSARDPSGVTGPQMQNAWPLKRPQMSSYRQDSTLSYQGDLGKYQSRLPGIMPSEQASNEQRRIIQRFSDISLAAGRTLLSTAGI